MDFKKDLLLVDLETTGLDASKQEIIQLAAVLLDKKTLKEKESFSSFVKPTAWKKRNLESMAVNRISRDQLKDAPSLKKVISNFITLFGHNVILAHYGGPVDTDFLRAAFKKLSKKFLFDYHYFNIWGVFFTYLALKGELKNNQRFTGFTLEDFMSRFKIKSSKRHDALEDCRIEAEILRQVIKELK